METTNIAIFASGNGSNAQAIAERLAGHPALRVALIMSDQPQAYVLRRAKALGIPAEVFAQSDIKTPDGRVAQALARERIGYIALAGYMRLIPAWMTACWAGRIVNIHPALLPKFGGRGMYGDNVHRAVLAAGERESGITIHLVDSEYDHGAALLQATCPVLPGDTPDTLAQRVHQLEHQHYGAAIEAHIARLSGGTVSE